MKKCKYCGTPQSDERHTCVDCGKPLPKPLSAEEAEVIEDALDAKINQTAFVWLWDLKYDGENIVQGRIRSTLP